MTPFTSIQNHQMNIQALVQLQLVVVVLTKHQEVGDGFSL